MPTKSPEGKIRISQKRARLWHFSGLFWRPYAPLWSVLANKGAYGALKKHEKTCFFHFFSFFSHFSTRIRPETGPKQLRSGISCQILGFLSESGQIRDFLPDPGISGKSREILRQTHTAHFSVSIRKARDFRSWQSSVHDFW